MTQALTVKDSPSLRAPVHHCLQKAGLKLAESATGEAALRLPSQRDFHPVLLDIVLPRSSNWEGASRMPSGPGPTRSLIFLGPVVERDGAPHDIRLADWVSTPFSGKALDIAIDVLLT